LERLLIKNETSPDKGFLHTLSASLPALKRLEIECNDLEWLGQSEPEEGKHFYHINMPYTSFDTVSLTYSDSQIEGTQLTVYQNHDDVVQQKRYFFFLYGNTSYRVLF
jgi:hypothetical protein